MNMNTLRLLRPLAILALPVLALALPARAAELTVLAAASLTDALKEAAPAFAAASGHTLRFNFGASGALARQIREGTPADVFISADEARMDQLAKAGLLLADTRRDLLANTLVVIVAAEGAPAVAALGDLRAPAIRRIALGDPATVPAGTYAKQHLEKVGLWTPLAEKFTPVDSVRAALAAVESGNVEAGFVYRTDALASKKVRVAVEIPSAEGPRIVYPVAALQESKQPDAARAFVAWLAGPEAQALFARQGFLPAP